jgi:hypothetical protein
MMLLCISMFSCIIFNNMLYYIVLFDKCCVYIKLNPNGVKVENTMTWKRDGRKLIIYPIGPLYQIAFSPIESH